MVIMIYFVGSEQIGVPLTVDWFGTTIIANGPKHRHAQVYGKPVITTRGPRLARNRCVFLLETSSKHPVLEISGRSRFHSPINCLPVSVKVTYVHGVALYILLQRRREDATLSEPTHRCDIYMRISVYCTSASLQGHVVVLNTP